MVGASSSTSARIRRSCRCLALDLIMGSGSTSSKSHWTPIPRRAGASTSMWACHPASRWTCAAELAGPPSHHGGVMVMGAGAGPQEHEAVQVGERTIICVAAGLLSCWLRRGAAGDRRSSQRSGWTRARTSRCRCWRPRERPRGNLLEKEIARLMSVHNVYRGRVRRGDPSRARCASSHPTEGR